MTINWNAVQAVAAGVGVGVAGAGIFFILRQLRVMQSQSAIAARAMKSELYSHVMDTMDRVNSKLLAQPDLMPYFYEDVPLPDDHELRPQADLVCETIMDMVDSVVEQRRAMPEDMDWSTWHAYFRWLHDHAPVLRTFLTDNVDFYPDYIMAAIGRVNVRAPHRGTVTSRWQAWEFVPPDDDASAAQHREAALLAKWLGTDNLPEPGYPWVRVWLFYSADHECRAEGHVPAAIADVDVMGWENEHEDAAMVRFIVTGEGRLDRQSEKEIRDWIVRTFDRTGIRWVSFKRFDTEGPWPDVPGEPWKDLVDEDLYGPRHFGHQSPPPHEVRRHSPPPTF